MSMASHGGELGEPRWPWSVECLRRQLYRTVKASGYQKRPPVCVHNLFSLYLGQSIELRGAWNGVTGRN